MVLIILLTIGVLKMTISIEQIDLIDLEYDYIRIVIRFSDDPNKVYNSCDVTLHVTVHHTTSLADIRATAIASAKAYLIQLASDLQT